MGESLVEQTLHDTYRIEKVVAEGGMGAVYEAAHLRLARRYAIKVITNAAAKHPQAAERFLKDWSALSALEHRHIAEAIDFFALPDGRSALVMEMLAGETLRERIDKKGRFDVAEAALILRQVASGLQSAHKKRVIHGDLRPSKILLCRTREKDDFVKIVGFGSTLDVADTTEKGLQYTAPEMLEHNGTGKQDHRSDGYSVAAMLFEMLTGKAPLSADSPDALRARITTDEPPKLREVREEIPEPVEYVIAKSLRKEPQKRYPSMGALSREFSSTLAL